jgi:branched-chain amino acid transport system permease protein
MLPLWGEIKLNYPRFITAIVSVVVILSLFLFLKKTTFGKTIGATADNEEGAMLVGIETNTVFRIAFSIACVLEAIAGSSITAFSVVDPYTGFTLVTKAWMVVVLSGLGSIPGRSWEDWLLESSALSSVSISASWHRCTVLILALVLILNLPACLER